MSPHKVVYASLFAAGLALPLSSPSYANIVISVNKSTQRMLVTVDGQTRYEWPVSTGRAGYGTPSGAFKPNRMDAMHYSRQYENAPMPHSIFFDLHGHAIHGFWDTPHLGLAVSHGCVRLSPANAAVLFALVKQEGVANTTVSISGQIPARTAPLVASRQVPTEQASEQPVPTEPGYGGQQAYAQYPAYTAPQPYGGPVYDRYGASSPYPSQPAPVYAYGRPAYQPYGGGNYRQPYGGGYYQRSYGGGYYQQQPSGLY